MNNRHLFLAALLLLINFCCVTLPAQSWKKSEDLMKTPFVTSPTPAPSSIERQNPDYMKPTVITEDEVTSALNPRPTPKRGGFWIGPRAGSDATPPPTPSLDRRRQENTMALKSLFEQAFATISKDKDAVVQAGRQLVLPDPERFFSDVFGPDLSPSLVAEYNQVKRAVETDFSSLIKSLKGRGQTQVYVVTVRTSQDSEANPHQRQAISAMKNPVPLYSIRFTNPTPGDKHGPYHVYSFVYVNGGFRFVGKLAAVTSPLPAPAEQPSRLQPLPADPIADPTPVLLPPKEEQNTN